MGEEKLDQNNIEEEPKERNKFISWVKNHKTELAIAGVGTAVCIKKVFQNFLKI